MFNASVNIFGEKNMDYQQLSDPVIYYHTSTVTLVLLILLYSFISLVTVLGNLLTIFIIVNNKKMQDVTNYFISNLAIADTVIGLFVTPFQVKLVLTLYKALTFWFHQKS